MKVLISCFQSWGSELNGNTNEKVAEFLETLERFVNDLSSARTNLQGHVSLTETDVSPALDQMRTASAYQSAGQKEVVLNLQMTPLLP